MDGRIDALAQRLCPEVPAGVLAAARTLGARLSRLRSSAGGARLRDYEACADVVCLDLASQQ